MVPSPTQLSGFPKHHISNRLASLSFPGISGKRLGVCGWILFFLSLVLVIITFPVSIWMCLKVLPWGVSWAVYKLLSH